jgi:protein SCO1
VPVRRPAALALAAGLLLTGCGTTAAATPATTSRGLHGLEPDRPTPRPDFTLTDTTGAPYAFREQTGGRPTLLFFGYTSCPDECYTAMADITQALRTSSSAVREQTRVVFVTTDPARDDGPRLRRWLDKYSTEYVGLTGTQEQVDAAQAAVGTPVATKGGPIPTLPGRPAEHTHAPGTAPHTHDSPLGYGVDHSSVIFAYDASDTLPVLYPGGSSPADLAADLPVLARKETS